VCNMVLEANGIMENQTDAEHIKELEEEVKNLNSELFLYKALVLDVEGIIHHVETHGSTPEDLREAVITLRVKASLAKVGA